MFPRFEKANKPPDAVFGVRFKNVGDGGALVWVNFCSSPRVQAPVTAADAIPVVVLEPTVPMILLHRALILDGFEPCMCFDCGLIHFRSREFDAVTRFCEWHGFCCGATLT